jgi:hypothetical protein
MVGVSARKPTLGKNNINNTTSLGMWAGILNWENTAVDKAAIQGKAEPQMCCH